MRALFLTNDVLGWRTFASMIERMAAERQDIDAVHVRLQSGLAVRLLSANANFRRAPGWLNPHARRVMVWRRILHRWFAGPLPLSRFDVVHVSPQLPAVAVADLKAVWGGNLTVSVDATMLEAKAQRNQLSQDRVARIFGPILTAERRVLQAADFVTAMSTWSATCLQREYGLPPERILRFPPVVPTGGQADGRKPEDVSSGLVRMAFVGNDWTRKGGPRLLKWHQARWADRVELHVFSTAKPIRGLRNLVWEGWVPNEELVQHRLPSMDLFVLPTYSDMSPWAAVEAASAGLPIVSSAIGGLPDIVVDGETGYLLPIEDEEGYVAAIDRLVSDPPLRHRMGRAARRHVERDLDARKAADEFFDRLVGLVD